MLKAITVALAIVSSAAAALTGSTCVRYPVLFTNMTTMALESFALGNETYIESLETTFPQNQALLLLSSYYFGNAALQLKQADALLTYCTPQCPFVPEPRVLCPCDFAAYNTTIADIETNIAVAESYEELVLSPDSSCEECKAYSGLLHETYAQIIADLNALSSSLRQCALSGRGRIF